jgi:hypothetical protein
MVYTGPSGPRLPVSAQFFWESSQSDNSAVVRRPQADHSGCGDHLTISGHRGNQRRFSGRDFERPTAMVDFPSTLALSAPFLSAPESRFSILTIRSHSRLNETDNELRRIRSFLI